MNKNGIFPTVFQLLRDARPEAEIGCLYEWEGIKYLVDTLSLNYHYHVADCNKTPQRIRQYGISLYKEKHPVLVAICYDSTDHTGHTEGHDTPAYYEKLKELDIYVGQIVQAVKDAGILDDTIFILTSDHGGIDKGHGGKTMQEMETLSSFPARILKKGLRFDDVSMMQYDVASTIASIFQSRTTTSLDRQTDEDCFQIITLFSILILFTETNTAIIFQYTERLLLKYSHYTKKSTH